MPATLATVTAISKEVYQGTIVSQLQEEAVGWKRIQSTSEGVTDEVGGKYVTFPVKVRRNAGIGYRNEMEALPAAGQQGFNNVRVGLKYGYGRVRLSGQTFKLVNKNFQAFSSAMDLEMTGLKNDLAKDTSRIWYGDGTGTVAKVPASTATVNTCVVSSAQYLQLGMQVDIGTAAQLLAATAPATNRQITAISGTTVTFDGAAVSLSATSLIVRTGNYLREPNGLGSIVTNSGALFNIDPATEPSWAAIVDANGGTNRALSEGLMITDTDNTRVNGGKTSLILMSLGVRRAYFNLLTQQRRYTNTTEFAGGLKGLAFNNGTEIPCIEDVDMTPNTMYGLEEDVFKIYQEADWDWMDQEGQVWKWVVGFDAYEAVLEKYFEVGINRRNANFKLTDITEG